MEKFSLGPDTFDRPGGLAMAMELFQAQRTSLKQVSITLREPGQLGPHATRTLFQSLEQITSLKKLGIGNVDATGFEMGRVFGKVLSKWSHTLEELRISSCLVDEEFVKCAKEALSRLTLLKVLVFHSCNVWKETYFGQFLRPIVVAPLTEVCLSSSNLTPASFPLLARTFREHTQIECLNLSGNNHLLRTTTTLSRGSAAHNPKLLKQLDSFFCETLTMLQNLRILYIHQCGIDQSGTLSLFRAVERMPRLERLMMYGSEKSLGDSWTRSLPRITGLTHLWVGRQVSPLSSSQTKGMCQNIQQNMSLLQLDVVSSGGYPSQDLRDGIVASLARNEFIRKARLVLVGGGNMPTALIASLLAALSPSSPPPTHRHYHHGSHEVAVCEATASYLVLRSTLEQWTSYALSTDSAVVVLAD